MKRLIPLYAGLFFTGFVFWYSIEKAFMLTIGFDSATIALMAAVLYGASLLIETPSGILADRWSRKGVLILATLSLGASSAIGGISHDISLYMLSAVFWGLFNAFLSGTSDSIIYDVLAESRTTNNYRAYLSIQKIISGVALVASSVIGGYISTGIDMRASYLCTLAPLSIALVCFLLIKEPRVCNETADIKVIEHTRNTFRVAFKNPQLTFILLSLICIGVVGSAIAEMYQLWYLPFHPSLEQIGIMGGLMMCTWGLSGTISMYLSRKSRVYASLLLAIVASVLLTFIQGAWLAAICLFIVGIIAQGLHTALTSDLHHHLPSRYRAGASSAIGTITCLAYIPIILLFGYVANAANIFVATWIIVLLIGITLVTEFLGTKKT